MQTIMYEYSCDLDCLYIASFHHHTDYVRTVDYSRLLAPVYQYLMICYPEVGLLSFILVMR